jgi:hypothetical protein
VLALRHPAASLVVALALAVTAGVFAFARPQYHEPRFAGERTIDLSAFPPAARGWTWAKGRPGYRFGEREQDWNIAQLTPADLASADRPGMTDIRPLNVMRLQEGLVLIVSASDSRGRLCLGFKLPISTPRFFCPPALAAQKAFVLAVPYGPSPDGLFLSGIVRADVGAVVWHQLGMTAQRIYAGKRSGAWGTFNLTTAGGPVIGPDGKPIATAHDMRLDFASRYGLVASVPLRFGSARERLIEVR